MVVSVWTPRGAARRIISLKKANHREQAGRMTEIEAALAAMKEDCAAIRARLDGLPAILAAIEAASEEVRQLTAEVRKRTRAMFDSP